MDQNFSLMAQSRANYYTAGSPVQFVRVELLKGDVTRRSCGLPDLQKRRH